MFKIQDGFQIDKSGTDFGIWTDPRDGQDYPYKKIGDQVWMLRNLAYGAKQGDNHAWVAGKTTLQSEGHAWRYEDQDNYLSWPFDRGAIYTLESLAWAIPDGWHIPSQAEMNVFKAWVQSKYGSSNGYPTKAIKTTTHWNTVKDGYGTQYPANGTDNFGFSLVSAGRAETNTSGTNIGKVYAYYGSKDQYDSGSTSYLWLSDPYQTTSRYYWSVGGSYNYVYSWNYYGAPASYAMGVRLIKDTPAASTEPEIESISVTIPSIGASDNKLATEKATKDYVDENAVGKGVLTTEGSILVAGADAVPGELAPGEEGQILSIASGVPAWVNASSSDKDNFANSDEVVVTGTGTLADPYTFDLTGKVQSTEDVDIIAARDASISFGRDMTVGSNSTHNITVTTDAQMSLTANYELDLTGSSIIRQNSGGFIYVEAPNQYHYVSNRLAIIAASSSSSVNARNIQFDGSLSEAISSKGVDATGYITETAAGPITITSTGSTAAFKGAGPTTVESTGGAPITVKSTGDTDNYSNLIFTPNAGTISVNASTANHTLTMFSKSVVDGTTNITELNLNDSTGASLHSSSAPIRVTSDNAPIYLSSPAGAPIQISSNVIGGQYGYSLVQTQGTSVTLKSYGDANTNGELAMTVNTMKLTQKGNANSYVELQSRNDSSNPATYSDLKLTPTSATLSAHDSVFLRNSQYGSSIGVNSSGKITGSGFSGVELVAEDDEHVILKANGEDNDGNIITSKLDLYANGDSYLTSPNGVIVETTEASTHAIFRNVIDDGQGGTYTVGLDVYQGGATLSSQAGPITLLTDQAPINLTSTSAPINILSPAGTPIALRSALMSGSTYSANIQLTGSVSISSPGGTVGISSIGPTSLLSTQGNITLDTTVGEIKISSNGGAPITSKVTGDSTHYTTVTENVTGLSVSVAGAPSPLSFSMVGDSTLGTSSATLSAKNISLIASQLPADTTGTSSISISNPPYGTISLSPTGLSFIYTTLPIFVNTNDLRLPAYAKAYDTTDTHKLMTRADTTGSVELATFSELTNEQFGLDGNTSAGTIFYVDQVADIVEPGDPQTYHPEVEKLSPGTTGQVLSVGSSGLEWTTPSTGTEWYLGAFTSAQRPASPTEGQYGYDTTIDCVIWYIGGYWKNSAGAIV